MQSDQNQIKLSDLLKLAKRNVSWQNVTPRSEKNYHKTDSQTVVHVSEMQQNIIKIMHACLLDLKNFILKDTQIPVLMMFKLEDRPCTLPSYSALSTWKSPL